VTQVRAQILGRAEFNQKMREIHKRLWETRPLMKSMAITAHKWILENYKAGGGKLKGRRWPRLMRSTQMSRRKKSNVPLMDTGHLQRQWNWYATKIKAIIGNPLDIALYHEEGTQPYIIKPKNRKALWFGTATSGVTPAIRLRGQRLGGHAPTYGKKVSKFGKSLGYQTPGIFRKYVHHPGLRARRQIPTDDEVMPDLLKVADVWLAKVTK